MEFYLRFIDVFMMIHLSGLVIISIFYIPYRVNKYKLSGTQLGLIVLYCYLWPITLLLFVILSLIKKVIINPILFIYTYFKNRHKNDSLIPKDERITIPTDLSVDERKTIPFVIDPDFIKAMIDANK